MSESDWGKLMTAALGGDAVAYRRLLDDLVPWLRQFFASRLPATEVEEAVRDTLITIHSKRHTFDPPRSFQSWLEAVAHYRWVNRLHTQQGLGTGRVGASPESAALQSANVARATCRRRRQVAVRYARSSRTLWPKTTGAR